MITLTGSPAALDAIKNDIRQDTVKASDAALLAVSELAVQFVQGNILEFGETGGNKRYPLVPLSWIVKRQTWPDGPISRGKGGVFFTPAQAQYYQSHKPLIDTGHLLGSFGVADDRRTDDRHTVTITSSTDYGWRQEYGEPGSDGPKQMYPRPHMYIPSESIDRMDLPFGVAFR